jgi:hypothetical protein
MPGNWEHKNVMKSAEAGEVKEMKSHKAENAESIPAALRVPDATPHRNLGTYYCFPMPNFPRFLRPHCLTTSTPHCPMDHLR